MQFERIVNIRGCRVPKALLVPDYEHGSVSGQAINHKGAGTHPETGPGMLLSGLGPSELAALVASPSRLADFIEEKRHLATNEIRPRFGGTWLEIFTGYDENNEPIGRFNLKDSMAIERPGGRFAGALAFVIGAATAAEVIPAAELEQ